MTSFISILLVLVNSVSLAQVKADSTKVLSAPVTGNFNFAALLFKTILSLAVVIVLLVLFVYGLKWLQSKTQSGYYKYHNMSIQDSLSVGPKRQIHLVQVMNRVILIGASETGINLLLELDEDEKKELAEKKEKAKPFSKSLSEQMSKLGGSVKH